MLATRSYDSHHAARVFFRGPVRVEGIRKRFRAKTRHVNLRGRHASGFDLIPVGERQIEIRTIAGARGEPAGNRRCRMTGVAKRRHHLRSHLSTTGPEARPNRRNEIGGVRSERLPHGPYGRSRSPLNRSPPAGVCRGDGADPAVSEQHRGTICHAHSDRAGGIVGHDHIGFRPCPRRRAVAPRDGHRRSVYLAHEQDPLDINANLTRNRFPFLAIVTQHEARGGEEVIGNGSERAASKHRAPGNLRPFESIARLGLSHEYPRTRVRRD